MQNILIIIYLRQKKFYVTYIIYLRKNIFMMSFDLKFILICIFYSLR